MDRLPQTTERPLLITASTGLLLIFFALAPVQASLLTGLAGVVALMALATGWRGLAMLPAESRLLWAAFALYVAAALLSLLNNENWTMAGRRFEKYHPFLLAIPIMGWLALLRDRLAWILRIGMAGAAITIFAVAVYEQHWLGAERTGYLGGLQPNTFGHLGTLAALVLLGHGLTADWRQRALSVLLAVGALYGVVTTGSRGALLAFLASLPVLLLAWTLRNGFSRRGLVLFCGGLLAATLLLTATFWLSEFWHAHWLRLVEEPKRFLAGDTQYTSIAARATMLISGWKTGMAHFWLGTGLGDVQIDYDRLMAAGELPPVPDNSNFHLHNIFVDAFASTGVIGLATMLLAVFALPLRLFIHRLRHADATVAQQQAAATGIALLANGFVFGLTHSWLYIRGLHVFLLLLLALLVLALRPPRAEESPR